MILQDLGDLVHRLHDAEFTVHKGDGHGDGVRAEQIFQMLQINGAVPLDVYKVDLAALLLQGVSVPLTEECSSGVEMICLPTWRESRASPLSAKLLDSLAPEV